jgi:hypothetical protein
MPRYRSPVLRIPLARYVLLLSSLLICVTGCSEREREWDRQSKRWTRLYPLLWGQAIEPSALEGSRKTFDCIWDGLTQAGREPREDVDCWNRQLDEMIVCSTPGTRAEVCTERSSRVCTFSAEYRRVARGCGGASAR